MQEKLQQLKKQLIEVEDIGNINNLLEWDLSTYMPPGGSDARSRQMGMLAQMQQEMLTDDSIGKLLDELRPFEESLPFEDDDASLIRVARRSYEKAVKVPPSLVAEITANASAGYGAWTTARPANDYAAVLPYLEKTLDLSRALAECFDYDHIADPLISNADEGMTAKSVRRIFADLRAALVPMVEQISTQDEVDNSVLHKTYPEALQRTFGEKIIRNYGYDFERGRQDLTHHPFMTKFGLGDVRITTRFDDNDFGDGLFSTLHESGHAMYEQGIAMRFDGLPIANGTSAGVHESQSRLWENQVGRSRAFWEHYYPLAQQTFPEQLSGVSLDTFYRSINKVARSLIRVDADELTYNLHVMIRFELELQLLEGSLALKDLPEAWHAAYESDLGLRAPNDSDGVLQDVHWYAGLIGGSFQGYTLGNVMSASFYDKALAAHPEISAQVASGEFATLHNWLRENIYQHGAKFTAPELIDRVLGGPLTIDPYVNYLHQKFGDLYMLT